MITCHRAVLVLVEGAPAPAIKEDSLPRVEQAHFFNLNTAHSDAVEWANSKLERVPEKDRKNWRVDIFKTEEKLVSKVVFKAPANQPGNGELVPVLEKV